MESIVEMFCTMKSTPIVVDNVEQSMGRSPFQLGTRFEFASSVQPQFVSTPTEKTTLFDSDVVDTDDKVARPTVASPTTGSSSFVHTTPTISCPFDLLGLRPQGRAVVPGHCACGIE